MNLLYLPNDNIGDIMDYIGNKCYIFSIINKQYLKMYKNKFNNTKTSVLRLYADLNINILKYAQKNKYSIKNKKFYLSEYAYSNNSWYKPGHPYNSKYRYMHYYKDNICDTAAKQKKFDCLEYLLRQGCTFNTYKNPSKDVIEFIVECIKVYGLRINNSVKQLCDRSKTAIDLLINNQFSSFKDLIESKCIINSNVAAQAALKCKIEYLECLQINKRPVSNNAVEYVKNNLEVKKKISLRQYRGYYHKYYTTEIINITLNEVTEVYNFTLKWFEDTHKDSF